MRRAVLAMLAAATAASVALPGAAAAAPDPTGFPCGLSSITDPLSDDGWQVGVVDAALVLTDGADPLVVHDGRLVCEVWIDGSLNEVRSRTANGVAVVAGTVHIPPWSSEIWLCMRIDLADGSAWYWDDASGSWVDRPATCALAIETEPVGPPLGELDPVA